MTNDALQILKDIIGDFAPEKFSSFFHEKSRPSAASSGTASAKPKAYRAHRSFWGKRHWPDIVVNLLF